ncbi:DUF927 domain-containing protein [Escherichia coli]|uniref:DUF927 domain-containing protein n=1 Tax=Escherichia coli TaxID=562 RepID=UPI001FCF10A2|nr:DUF927 domain-containing protein [Escherichia coli]
MSESTESTEEQSQAPLMPPINQSINAFAAKESLDKAGAKKNLALVKAVRVDDIEDIKNHGVKAGLPSGYRNTADGLYDIRGKHPVLVCPVPILPYAVQCAEDKRSCMGLRLMALNSFGKYVTASVSVEDIAASAYNELIKAGFCIGSTPQQASLLEQFLYRCMKMKLPVYLVSDAMGFVADDMAFLHGHTPIVTSLKGFHYLTPGFRVKPGIHPKGAMEGWQQLIHQHVYGWAQVFVLSASLASMLLVPAGMDVSIFHFHGGSTTGKTILLQLAASVHGNGNEPGSSSGVNIMRWNTTPNALERSLSDFSGLVACIDELGASNHKDFLSLLYNMTSGVSKERLNKAMQLCEPYKWRMLILSSGEMSIATKLASQKESVQGGQEHRAISIEVLPEDAQKPGESKAQTRQRADVLKNGLGEVYGHAGPEFIRILLSQTGEDGNPRSFPVLSQWLTQGTEECCNCLVRNLEGEGIVLTDIQRRAMKRFALVWLAGEMAVVWGILPFADNAVEEAVMMAARRWLGNNQNQYNPVRQMLNKLQLSLLTKEARHFIKLHDEDARTPGDQWGFTHPKGKDFLIYEAVFDKLCVEEQVTSLDVAKSLNNAGYLVPESPGHYKKRPLQSMAQSYYRIKREFLQANIASEF